MNLSAPFINRPVATTLLTIALILAGLVAYLKLPVAPLPQVDFPTISVFATMPGASPETMAATVATPLERHLGFIADVTEMTSQSTVGQTRIALQFGLARSINGAARDVQAAINAARADLPTSLRQNPSYRKVNPADAPIVILALTSKTLTPGQIYDSASTTVQQALSQIGGIGQVVVSGSSLPAVRVELNPLALFKYGIGLEDVRAALASANAHSPKGALQIGDRRLQIYTNDQADRATDYRPLIVAYRNGAPVRLADVAEVHDSVENVRNEGLSNGQPAVLVFLYPQPGANIIQTVDRVKAVLPQLEASIPRAIRVELTMDRSKTIKASVHDVQQTLVIATVLVILVVFLFLRNFRAASIPTVVVPVSIIGTFGAMHLLGYSLDNLSLMALTISTGFVVDDAIVVLENVTRHIEAGMSRRQAALQGSREVGFTVLAMSLSLIAVFAPILLMGGVLGRLLREFAATLSIAIAISLVVSLTTTPMMCACVLHDDRSGAPGTLNRIGGRAFGAMLWLYDQSLRQALRWPALIMLSLIGTLAFAGYQFVIIPKGFIPAQDNGLLAGRIQADQSISFQAMRQKLVQFAKILQQDPAVETVDAFTGGIQTNSGFIFVVLKPLSERKVSMDQVMRRLKPVLDKVAGAELYFDAVTDLHVGARVSNATYQYTLLADDTAELYEWAPKVEATLRKIPLITDVNLDQQQNGLESDLVIDRNTAARLGLNVSEIDNTLYDAFGQRQVSVIYAAQNQYHVVMEVAPRFWQTPEILKDIYVSTSGGTVSGTQSTNAVVGTVMAASSNNNAASTPSDNPGTTIGNDGTAAGVNHAATTADVNHAATTAAGSPATNTGPSASAIASDTARNQANNSLANTGRGATSTGAAVSTAAETMVPLSAVANFAASNTPLAVNHQNLSVAATISFNLAPGASLGEATAAISTQVRQLGLPASIHGGFQGTARAFRDALGNELYLIAAAVLTVYIVLGVLYESCLHPITILSTLPSAGAGAVLALVATHSEFNIIALIGVILLIGIVMKNAIIMIDFALDAERNLGLGSREAIYQACLKRFRPIMMTTLAAMFGAVPLAIAFGEGAELRRPLGISIVGGLIVSQVLTLYTTPVIYLYLDRFRLSAQRRRQYRPG
ncbi:MAG: efflux RND transporter permease subunit [Stellaceae bacterium]